jgi:hypothetical protein
VRGSQRVRALRRRGAPERQRAVFFEAGAAAGAAGARAAGAGARAAARAAHALPRASLGRRAAAAAAAASAAARVVILHQRHLVRLRRGGVARAPAALGCARRLWRICFCAAQDAHEASSDFRCVRAAAQRSCRSWQRTAVKHDAVVVRRRHRRLAGGVGRIGSAQRKGGV